VDGCAAEAGVDAESAAESGVADAGALADSVAELDSVRCGAAEVALRGGDGSAQAAASEAAAPTAPVRKKTRRELEGIANQLTW
jgi:hypothetical protein